MLKEYDVSVLSHRKEIIDISNDYIEITDRGLDHKYRLLADILLTKEHWGSERTIILPGDVIYTPEALIKALNFTKDIEFFASADETFAICINKYSYHKVIKAIEYILALGLEATTWELYRSIAGIPLDKHWMDCWYHHRISDKTDDIDYPEDYRKKVETKYFDDMQYTPIPNYYKGVEQNETINTDTDNTGSQQEAETS